MSKPRSPKAPSDGVSIVTTPTWDFDEEIRSLESGVFPLPGAAVPKDRMRMARGLLRMLVDSKIYFNVPLSDAESEWLTNLLFKLSENRVALRALGYKQSKAKPDRDLYIAEDYSLLRAYGVKANAAIELIIRKWSESESNIKRLISVRSNREAAKRRLGLMRAATVGSSPAQRHNLHREMGLALVWKRHAIRERDGRVSADAQAAAAEIERLTGNIFKQT